MDIIELLKSAFLGLVEGITEWLPISSTGHMILVDEFIKLNVTEEFWNMFLVVIQLGAILAVCVLFIRDLLPFGFGKTRQECRDTWSLWGKIIVGVIACGLNSAAYVAELIRGGIESVDKGQTEAGRSLGLNGWQTMRLIVLPQALKTALPSLCNEFIVLIKETSVLAYIALTDLTKAADYIRSRTFSPFTSYIVSALLYLVVISIFTKLVGKLERRLRRSDNR